jgi:hypothetical protein
MSFVPRIGLLAMSLAALPATALANPYDISLRGLGRPPSDCRNATNCADDKAVVRYRSLANELAAAMAPRMLAPAETLGMSGFEISLATAHTPISSDADYWQGQPGAPVFEGVSRKRNVPDQFWTPTVHLRKGLPLSSEIGVQGSYLAFSEMFMLGGEFKLALHESFSRWIPSLASRIAVSRLFGASDLDIICGEVDGVLSLPFGVGGMAQITPYVGGGLLFVDVSSQVIDSTPYLVTDDADQRGGGTGSLYTFPRLEWQDNGHQRAFVGMRFIVAFIEILAEWNLTMIDKGPADISTYTVKLGFDT